MSLNFHPYPQRRYITDGVVNPSAPIMIFFDQSEEDHARQAGSEMRRVLLEGSGSGKLNAYVNYVSEGESLQEIYGHEPWRIEKLKELKKRYDPKRRFGYFAPIA